MVLLPGGLNSRLGFGLFLAVFILDQATKWAAFLWIPETGPIEVTSFFNIVLVWNTGVSFGLFQNDGTTGRWVLIALAIAISCVVLVLLAKESHKMPICAYWLVLAGAAGNVVDRFVHGAVVDFLDFHLHSYHWPAFNIADSAIVVGAGLLIVDSLFRRENN